MSLFSTLFVLAIVSSYGDRSTTLKVDLIEINHCYDDLGRHCYDQLIFWDWCPEYRRYHIRAWRLLGENSIPLARNRYDDSYVYVFTDNDSKKRYEIRSKLFRETWTIDDPERLNKKLFEEKYRTPLFPKKMPVCK